MPYKFNEPRRHKIPTAKYRVTNWPDYDAALVRRGALTVWFTDAAIAAWRAPATGRRGGQPIYSALAIETALTIRVWYSTNRCVRPKDCYDPLPMCSASISPSQIIPPSVVAVSA